MTEQHTITERQPDSLVSGMRGFRHERLYSLDALRGFDMFWIMGAEDIVQECANATHEPFWQAFAIQLTHPQWNGFHFYDLIFPLFIFLSGVSVPYSLGPALDNGVPKSRLLLRIIRRGLLLVLFGIILNVGRHFTSFGDIRYGSVLGRIGLAYMFASIIFLYAHRRAHIIWCAGLLIGYWLLLKFTSAPGYPMGDLTMQGNFASYLDRLLMPGKLVQGIHDPEGLTATIPAIANALIGVITGSLLKDTSVIKAGKVLRMAIAGIILVALGLLWKLDFPINKNLWSSSYVLLTCGLSLLLLALFYYIIDVKGYRKWPFFFRVIGMNALLIYIASRAINWGRIISILFGWLGSMAGIVYGAIVLAVCLVVVKWLLLYVLYRKKIFLRV